MHKKLPSLLANYLYSVSYQLLDILVPLISTPYISRVLHAEGVGAFSYASTITMYFSMFGILGLNLYGQVRMVGVRDGDRAAFSRTFGEIFTAKALTMSVSILLYIGFIALYGQYRQLFSILALMLFAELFDISWLYQGMENFRRITFRNYVTRIASLLLMLLFVKSEADIGRYALIAQGGNLLGNLILWIGLHKYVSAARVSFRRVLYHLKACLPYFLPSLSACLMASADIVMLGAILGSDRQTGLYVQAQKTEQIVALVLAALGNVLLPRITWLFDAKEEEKLQACIRQALRVTGFLAVPMACGLCTVSDVLVPVFLGADFSGSVRLIRIFSFVLLISGINGILGNNCLIAQQKIWGYNLSVSLGAGVNVLLNAVLIPVFQCDGAVFASLLSEFTVFLCFLHFAGKETAAVRKIFDGWSSYVPAGLLMGLAVWLLDRVLPCSFGALLFLVAAGTLLYLALVLLLRDSFVLSMLARLREYAISRHTKGEGN